MRPPKETPDATNRTLRIISVVAGTFISLSCGTNYGFSAWAPQFAEKLHLSGTEINLMGNFGNLGMYAMGIPGGYLIDTRGPRAGVLFGAVCLAAGYFPLRRAYDAGAEGTSLAALCLFMLLTGVGSCTAFSASIKVCATNWPRHRGTATGLPLGAFGLSAFFFTAIAAALFPNDASGYLALMGYGTTLMVFAGMFFLAIVPQSTASYAAIPHKDDDESPTRGERRSGLLGNSAKRSPHGSLPHERVHAIKAGSDSAGLDTETSTLVNTSRPASPRSTGDLDGDHVSVSSTSSRHRSRARSLPRTNPDITGWALIRTPKFWSLFLLLALLAGVGLMTINNIGNNARALWHHFDPRASKPFIQSRQMLHVSILSLCSFAGRLLSGIGSDLLLARRLSRFWTLVVSATVSLLAQLLALRIADPNFLFLLSGLSGLAYGMLFGVYPALVADAFGPAGMGINWGCMTLAPVLSANAFNLLYGRILDAHSIWDEDSGERVCGLGLACYRDAYWVTLAASVGAIGWIAWCMRVEAGQMRRERERWEHDP